MENFFIVIVIIAFVLYKLYTNYMKEIDAAKKRNYKKRSTPHTDPSNRDFESVNNGDTKTIAVNSGQVTLYENTESNIPEEVKAIRNAKKLTTSKNKSEENDHLLTEQSFDLRQAVIHSIILERPYK